MLFNNAGEWMREDNTYTKEGFQVSCVMFCDNLCEGCSSNFVARLTSLLRLCLLQIMIGVQHFSHFYLTMLLIDKLKASAPARIIYTSSASEATAQKEIPWDNLG